MAKNVKNEDPNPNAISNQDIIQRLNFLYQASVYLQTVSSQHPAPTKKKSARKVTTSDLAKTYISTFRVVSQKTTSKVDPGVKRTICRGCNIPLIPGSTAFVRVKRSTSHRNAMTYTCSDCKTSRRIPAPPTMHPDTVAFPSIAGGSVQAKSLANSKARVPPFFARDVGHVVFRGNEKLSESEPDLGNGIYIG